MVRVQGLREHAHGELADDRAAQQQRLHEDVRARDGRDGDREADGAGEEEAHEPVGDALHLAVPGLVDDVVAAEAQAREERAQQLRRARVLARGDQEHGHEEQGPEHGLGPVPLGDPRQHGVLEDPGHDAHGQKTDGADEHDHGGDGHDVGRGAAAVDEVLHAREQRDVHDLVDRRGRDDELADGLVQHGPDPQDVQRDARRDGRHGRADDEGLGVRRAPGLGDGEAEAQGQRGAHGADGEAARAQNLEQLDVDHEADLQRVEHEADLADDLQHRGVGHEVEEVGPEDDARDDLSDERRAPERLRRRARRSRTPLDKPFPESAVGPRVRRRRAPPPSCPRPRRRRRR